MGLVYPRIRHPKISVLFLSHSIPIIAIFLCMLRFPCFMVKLIHTQVIPSEIIASPWYIYIYVYIYVYNICVYIYIYILITLATFLFWMLTRKFCGEKKTFSLLEGSIPSCSQRPAGGRCCPSSWGFSSSSTIKNGDVMISLYVVYIYIRSESLYFTMFFFKQKNK